METLVFQYTNITDTSIEEIKTELAIKDRKRPAKSPHLKWRRVPRLNVKNSTGPREKGSNVQGHEIRLVIRSEIDQCLTNDNSLGGFPSPKFYGR